MYIDKETQLSNAQAVTVAAASTNIIDLQSKRDVGVSEVVFALTVNENVTAAGAATVRVALQGSNTSDFSASEDLVSTGDLGKAVLVVGRKVIYLIVPPNSNPYQFLRGYYTIGTGPLTAGKFTLAAVEGPEAIASYKAAIG